MAGRRIVRSTVAEGSAGYICRASLDGEPTLDEFGETTLMIGGRPGLKRRTARRYWRCCVTSEIIAFPSSCDSFFRGRCRRPRYAQSRGATTSYDTFLGSLEEADRTALLGVGHRRTWERTELLLRAGDRADHAIILIDGFVKVHLSAAHGVDVVLDLSGPGDLLGEAAAFSGGIRSASATALAPVEGLMVDIRDLRDFVSRRPRVTSALLEMTLVRLHAGNARRTEFATTASLARMAGRLVELTERFGAGGANGKIEVALPITQEELASWSASSRESAARSLRTLRTLGLIQTHRRRLTVLDIDRLRAHAPP